MAVTTPNPIAPTAQTAKPWPRAITPSEVAWTASPQAISPFRPIRSESAPVPTWPAAETSGWIATSAPICGSDIPRSAKQRGNSPHARPSFRLLVNPAAQLAAVARSLTLTNVIHLHVDPRQPAEPPINPKTAVAQDPPSPIPSPETYQTQRQRGHPTADEDRIAPKPIR